MAMKKATMERITAAYERGLEEGEDLGYKRALEQVSAEERSASMRKGYMAAFTNSLDKEVDPE